MNEENKLLAFIRNATSPYHVVQESEALLKEAGFTSLVLEDDWNLEQGTSNYTKVYGTTLFAFSIGTKLETPYFRIASAHTDHPCLHIKPIAEYPQHNYLRVNVEVYGGPIKNTWLDRPLSIAGKVVLKSDEVFHPRTVLIDCKRPLLTIPNIAIHMNPELNKGVELNNQSDMIPLLGMLTEEFNKEQYFFDFLEKELEKIDNKITKEDILDFDLYVYNTEEGCLLGLKNEFISCPRLDNLTSVYALTTGLIHGRKENSISMIALFDNEEIGSQTKQGADSMISQLILEKIYESLFGSLHGLTNAILKSHMISVDVAHGLHPNHVEKSDPTNVTQLNQGICLKMNSNQRYATDSEAIGAIEQLCKKHEISYQKYVNRSNIAGGHTLGSLSSSWLPMKTVDLGVPLLAMHSARELMGVNDQTALNQLLVAFFTE